MSKISKRKIAPVATGDFPNEELGFIREKASGYSNSSSDNDSTDSEESEYSGLEDEEESENDSSVMSFEQDSEESASDTSNEDIDDRHASSDENIQDEESEDAESTEDENMPSPSTSAKHKTKKFSKKVKVEKISDDNDSDSDENKNIGGKSKKHKLKMKKINIKEEPESVKPVTDEYEYDSSDEEDIRNTVGNIPMEWYKEYAHIGYDVTGEMIKKPKSHDELDEFIKKMDDPNYWRTIKDKMTGQDVILSDKDIDTIQRIKGGKYVDPGYDPYEPWVDTFTSETMLHPLSNRPADKRSFIPSKLEALKVGKLVHAIKMGWLKPKKPKEPHKYYMLWKDDDNELNRRVKHHIPAPKLPLPGHAESYNPPAEYLLTEEEELQWKGKDPEDRRLNFLPQKSDCLRKVPGYRNFIRERFERCLDLYLCPRKRKIRMNVNPEDLIPKLPKPKDLQPFPTTQSLVYKGHEGLVRCLSVDPLGQWLVSGSDDKTVKTWEITTGRCMRTYQMSGVVRGVAWNPNSTLCLIAVVVDNSVVILNPQLGDKLISSNTDNVINQYVSSGETEENKLGINWHVCEDVEQDIGYRIKVIHPQNVSLVTWHGKGDYFAVVMPHASNQSVCIHQLSKRRSQNPFNKSKGLVQRVLFHPVRPFLFVATQRYVRVYNLLKQELTKKLMTNVRWVSSMAVHPGGDNVIVGSYDCKLSWFDMDLSTKPYQTLRHHKKAIRSVCYHKRYPLFASASDDGTVIVCHGMVYNDLLQNPLIVPVKVLRGHEATKELGVLDCTFHPTQPWLFSSGADCTIRLYT